MVVGACTADWAGTFDLQPILDTRLAEIMSTLPDGYSVFHYIVANWALKQVHDWILSTSSNWVDGMS